MKQKNKGSHFTAAVTLHPSRQQHERYSIKFHYVTDIRKIKGSHIMPKFPYWY
jgi:hypothetical protein